MKSDWKYNLLKLELALTKPKESGIKCYIENYFLVQTEMEYLGFWVTSKGVWLLNKNLEAITNITPPTSQNGVHKFMVHLHYIPYLY